MTQFDYVIFFFYRIMRAAVISHHDNARRITRSLFRVHNWSSYKRDAYFGQTSSIFSPLFLRSPAIIMSLSVNTPRIPDSDGQLRHFVDVDGQTVSSGGDRW